MNVTVPFLDLRAQYESIRADIDRAIEETVGSCAFCGGPVVERFEKEFAAYCHSKEAVGVGSGTEALWLILMALGVGAGDEVITVANTFIATAEAITMTGAIPVFVDVDSSTYTMDPDRLEPAITPRTKAIIPVHLYGQTADMDPILAVARAHGLHVVEDACQAHGAEYKGRRAGSLADAAAFSFYPGKNLGAYGEAGVVTTNDETLAETIRMLRDHGQRTKYHHDLVGWNCRMDGIQAAVLGVKLKHLEEWTEARRRNAQIYRELLSELESVVIPEEAPYARHVYHLFVVRVPERDRVLRELTKAGIQCGIHYPIPIHLQPAYQGSPFIAFSCETTTRFAGRLLSLPMSAELNRAQTEVVVKELEGAQRTARPTGVLLSRQSRQRQVAPPNVER